MKIGILGAGNIAGTMAGTLSKLDSAEAYAVASRDKNRAEEFAEKYGLKKNYGSYEELVQDKEVDLIYVATPHSFHYEHMKLCVEHGKAVLCEKAFTQNAKEAKEILALAKEKKVFVAEAIWTRYMPSRKMISEIMESGIIGEITSLQANLGYPVAGKERLRKPELAGGALLDLGVYPINFAMMAFGNKIKEVKSTAVLTEEGVDASNSITLLFQDGKMAVLHSNMTVASDRRGVIYGSLGYMEIKNINNCESVSVYNIKHEHIKTYQSPEQITGYEYEVEACCRAIKEGRIECEEMSHTETLKVMELMDAMRREWGVIYPNDLVE